MHAFMALFFYELVCDQIVFIWHAWATVVVHRWSLFLSAGPCLQHFFDDEEKCSYWPSDVKDRTILIYLFICFFLFMNLFICAVWFKIWALILPLTSLLVSATLYHYITYYHFRYWQVESKPLKRLILHFPVGDKLFKTMQRNTKALCIFVSIHSYCSLVLKVIL